MDPVGLVIAVIFAAIGFFVLWLVIRSAVEWGILRAAQRMKNEGRSFPVAQRATRDSAPRG